MLQLLPFALALLPLACAAGTSTSTSTSSSSIQRYTYTLLKTAAPCPTLASTKSLHTRIASASSSGPTFTAYGTNFGSIIPQVTVPDTNGSRIAFQMSNTSQIILKLPSQQTAVIDNNGAYFWNHNCTTQMHLPVPNLTSVVTGKGPHEKRIERVISLPLEDLTYSQRRAVKQQQVPISVQYLDQCGTPLDGHTASAECTLFLPGIGYQKITDIQLSDTSGGIYVGSCSYPGNTNDEISCEKTVTAILDYPTTGLLGQFTNLQGDLRILGKIFSQGIVADSIAAAFVALDIPAVATGLGALGLYQGIISAGGDSLISRTVCHAWASQLLAIDGHLDNNPQTRLNYQNSPPFTAVTTTQTVTQTTVTACPKPSTCKKFVCGTNITCGDTGSCYCFQNSGGKHGLCVSDFLCADWPACDTNLDCSGNEYCATNTCCIREGYAGNCVPRICSAQTSQALLASKISKNGKKAYKGHSGLTAAGLIYT